MQMLAVEILSPLTSSKIAESQAAQFSLGHYRFTIFSFNQRIFHVLNGLAKEALG
jgi:hypothetical protein